LGSRAGELGKGNAIRNLPGTRKKSRKSAFQVSSEVPLNITVPTNTRKKNRQQKRAITSVRERGGPEKDIKLYRGLPEREKCGLSWPISRASVASGGGSGGLPWTGLPPFGFVSAKVNIGGKKDFQGGRV